MKEYEIDDNNKNIGNLRVYNSINSNVLIESKKNVKYRLLNQHEQQTYIIKIKVDSVDELYSNISVYNKLDVFSIIDEVKKMNNVKNIKKDTILDIIVPSIYLKSFNYDIKNVDLTSLFYSKVNFLKKALMEYNIYNLKKELNNIIITYNDFKNRKEYEFLTADEKKEVLKKYIKNVDKIILYIEQNTDKRFGYDYITPIRINK